MKNDNYLAIANIKIQLSRNCTNLQKKSKNFQVRKIQKESRSKAGVYCEPEKQILHEMLYKEDSEGEEMEERLGKKWNGFRRLLWEFLNK